MQITVVTLAERPDLIGPMWQLPSTWPEYMLHDPVADVCFDQLPTTFPEYQLVAVDESGTVVGKLHSLPFRWDGTDDDLPDRGWEAILERGFAGHDRAVTPNAASLIEARVAPDLLGTGLSPQLLLAARRNVAALGIASCSARFARPRSIANHTYRWPTTSPGCVRTACRRIPGCARTCAWVRGSSRSAQHR